MPTPRIGGAGRGLVIRFDSGLDQTQGDEYRPILWFGLELPAADLAEMRPLLHGTSA